jgi:putative DNA primase/helicase
MKGQPTMIDPINDSLNSDEMLSSDEPLSRPSNYRILDLVSQYASHLSDHGNACRFVSQFGHQVRYVPSFGWFLFDGLRWHLDDSDQILALAHSSIQSYYDEASKLADEDELLCERILKHAERSSSLSRLSALLTIARSLPGISVPYSQFDASPYLLTCLNGTLDLRTGMLSSHSPAHYITRLIPINYDPDLRSSFWDTFIARFTDHNPTFQKFLQRAIGYSLSGLTSEETCFLLTGPDQSAQQIFLSTLRALFGDYASHLPALHQKYLTPSLSGARLATIPTHAFLSSYDPSTLATLIGSELLPLSPSSTMTYQPHTKLWFSTPDQPRLPAAISYLRTRITLIPITLSLPHHEAVQLSQQLLDALPAILTWAVQGYMVWSYEGLLAPDCVTDAGSSFQDEQDDLGSFLETCCTTGDDSLSIRAHDLYQAHALWSRVHSTPRLSEHAFFRLILLRGFRRTRQNSGRFYHGITLLPPFNQISTLLLEEHDGTSV